jgi:type I restriction enzyme S subunit
MNNNKHIPQGYKDSPLGIIPKEWKVKKVLDFAPLQRGFDLPTDKIVKGKYPVVYSNGILNYHDEYKAKGPGVVTGRSGTIGKVTYVESDYWPHNTSLWVTDFKGNSPKYVYYVYKYMGLSKYASGSGVPTLNRNDVHVSKIAIPPIEEQSHIVKVLDLWDTAIEKYSELIKKLKLRKRALMQQLLTGKKRLPGFSGEWKRIKLGDIAERITRKNEEDNKNVVTISAQRGFVVQTDFFNKSVASEVLDNYFLVYKDEFCYNKSYSNGYPMGAIKRLKSFDKAVVTTLYICFKLKNMASVNIDFFEQYCESGIFNKELIKVANEGGRAHGLLNVTPTDFFNMHMRIPNIDEQNAIATVLVNADKEIEFAKEKLSNLQSQKRGIMQQLLTGKKRIIENEI